MKFSRKNFLSVGLTSTVMVGGFLLFGGSQAFAAYLYNPSDLISDTIFSNSSSMSVSAIQTFLNNENSGLKSYSDTENCSPAKPPTSSTYPYTYSYTYYPHCGKKVSAATIIYDAGKAYGINPQAIMATLQKEQSLITTPDPLQSQINCAMGYSSCNGDSGFFSQVDNGAWQFRTDIKLMNGQNWWGFSGTADYACNSAGYVWPNGYPNPPKIEVYSAGLFPGRTLTIDDPHYSDDPYSTGRPRTITIASSATAALYCYTPYVGPYTDTGGYSGTGYSGSFNFVQSFEQWWGSTVYDWAGDVSVAAYSDAARTQPVSLTGPFLSGTKLYVTVSAINTGSQTWDSSFTHLGVIGDYTSSLYDTSWFADNRPAGLMQSSVAPTQTGTFEFSLTTPNVDGTYPLNLGLVADGKSNGWMKDSSTYQFSLPVSNPYNGAITSLNAYSDSNHTQLTDTAAMTTGEKVYVQMKVKNIGSNTWSNAFTKVSAGSSAFDDGSWTAANRPAAMVESSVAAGQTGTFDFTLTAPGTTGSYNETFGMIADGQTNGTMPAPNFTLPIKVVASPLSTFYSGYKLYPGQQISSPNGDYTLSFQTDGNLVLRTQGTPVWSTGTTGTGTAVAVMQTDGNFVLYNAAGKVVWATKTGSAGSVLSLQNDGNLVIYTTGGQPAWASGSDHNITNTPFVLTTGARLTSGTANNELLSSNSAYALIIQHDGNLVLYNKAGKPLWATGTNNGSFFTLQSDGNLVLYTASGHPVWASGSKIKGAASLPLQTDGNLVLYSSSGRAMWTTGT